MRVRTAIAAVPATMGVTAVTVSRLFQRQVTHEIGEVLASGARSQPRIIAASDVDLLPEPVQRWLRWAGIAGKPYPGTVRLRQRGEFWLNGSWQPFRADQYFSIEPPGFVWQVSVQVASLLPMFGRDRWTDGDCSLQMRILGVVPVTNSSGQKLAQGAMLRWLGEIIWFPQAAIAPAIGWERLDDNSARATITAGGQTGSATFVFDAEGRPIEYRADRFNDSKKRVVPFVNINREYGSFHGVRIPTAGEALWKYETGDFPYIRWEITQVSFDIAAPFPARVAPG
jgi:hypothetical protein